MAPKSVKLTEKSAEAASRAAAAAAAASVLASEQARQLALARDQSKLAAKFARQALIASMREHDDCDKKRRKDKDSDSMGSWELALNASISHAQCSCLYRCWGSAWYVHMLSY